jgi:four helix bundle protein
MASLTRFEEIAAWQKARMLTRRIYEVTGRGAFARDFELRHQIRRAAVSSMSNIAEGFERDGNSEFRQFLAIAKGSAGEVKSQLYVALDAGYLSPEEFEELYRLASETGQLIGGFSRYLSGTELRGAKYNR